MGHSLDWGIMAFGLIAMAAAMGCGAAERMDSESSAAVKQAAVAQNADRIVYNNTTYTDSATISSYVSQYTLPKQISWTDNNDGTHNLSLKFSDGTYQYLSPTTTQLRNGTALTVTKGSGTLVMAFSNFQWYARRTTTSNVTVYAYYTPTMLAVGDIATDSSGGTDWQYDADDTAVYAGVYPGAIAIIGDGDNGDVGYTNTFRSTWGANDNNLWRMRPVPGNHDYTGGTLEAAYTNYFGSGYSAGYNYKVGAWNVIALNSRCLKNGTCTVAQALPATTTTCTLAYFHNPRYSSGVHGQESDADTNLTGPASAAVWQALYDAGVDIVLSGHDHHYERSKPINRVGDTGSNITAQNGMVQYVVGTGGTPLRAVSSGTGRSAQIVNKKGVFRLVLKPTSYDYRFMTADDDVPDYGNNVSCD